ncbi:hypothetical protein ACFL1G_12155 [Planctomycetota bacterium]
MKYKAIFIAAVFSLVYFTGYAQSEEALGKSAWSHTAIAVNTNTVNTLVEINFNEFI